MPVSRPPRRLLPVAAVLAFALPALLLATPPAAVAGTPQVPCTLSPVACPDLIVDPLKLREVTFDTRSFSASSCDVLEGHVPGPGSHRLLRFTFTTPNVGTADLVVGSPADHPEWFEYAPCHRHYHFREYADYRLWTEDGYTEWVALRALHPTMTAKEVLARMPDLQDKFVAGQKQGFCVIDIVDYAQRLLPANWRSCGNQGISVGWADEYSRFLSGQWIVVTEVPPGDYMLEAEVNAERLYEELSYDNNAWAVPVTV